MSDQCYLGIDLGAESGRVMAGQFDGAKISLEEMHRFPNGPVSVAGSMRWDVLGLWSQIQTGLTKSASQFGDSIVSAGVDTWGVDYVMLSKDDEIVGQPYNYRDTRTNGMFEYAFSRVKKEEIFSQTGLQFMEINTLYQLLAHKRDHPELMELVDRFLMIPDFLHWLLCGSKVVEFTNATTTQCLNAQTRDWAFDMLNEFELPTNIFPEVVSPGTELGKLRADISTRTGLNRIPIVTPPTHDTGAAIAAVPTQNTGTPNWAYISSGTWSLVGVEVQEAILTPEALAQNVTNEGGVDGTYRLLKNVMGLWLVQGCKRSFEKAGRSLDYTQITKAAEQAEPFRSIINPNDESFINPVDMPTAIRDWCKAHGEPVPETDGQLVRCALESLALKYRNVLEGLEKLTGVPIEVIHIVGGGCNNELLNRFTANAFGKPVLAGPVEATVMGNVLIQARAAGEIASLSDLRDVVLRSTEIKQFSPQDESLWNAAYDRYLKLS